MKLQKYSVTIVIFVIVVGESQCGVIDNIFGRVKNTTIGLKQDVSNIWSYGKGIVGLESENSNLDNRTEEEKRGLIGGMVHSAREKVHSIRNHFWNTDELSTDAGVFGNLYNRVKNRLSKVKGFFIGDNQVIEQTTQPISENAKLVRDTLNKLFFRNGTRQIHGNAFQEAIENLRKKLHEIRSNMTLTTATPVHHGEGLIDVRIAAENIQDNFNDNTAGIDNDIYDKVDDSLSDISDKTAKSYNNTKDNVDKGVDELRNGIESTANQINGFKDKLSDTAAKENKLLETSYNKFNANAQNVGDSVKNTIEDAKRLSY